MKASEKIKTLMKQWEGLKLRAYRCPSGILTIGYGHTGQDVKPGMSITREHAESLFASDIAKFETQLNNIVSNARLKLRQGQYDALLSFAYNVGITALIKSTLWRKLAAGADDVEVATEFGKWVYGNGKRLPGLIKRRAEEARIYASQ